MSLHFNDLFLGVPPCKSVSGRSFCRYVVRREHIQYGCVYHGAFLGLQLGPAWRVPHSISSLSLFLLPIWRRLPSRRISMGEETKAARRRKGRRGKKRSRDGATRPACFQGILRCCWQTLFFLPLPAYSQTYASAFFRPSFFSSRFSHSIYPLISLGWGRYSAIRKNPYLISLVFFYYIYVCT